MNTMIRNSWGKTFLSLIVLLLNIAVHRLFWNLFRDFYDAHPGNNYSRSDLGRSRAVSDLLFTELDCGANERQVEGEDPSRGFIGPAVLLLAWLLLFPAIRTLLLSFLMRTHPCL